jgi:hypothetical protein
MVTLTATPTGNGAFLGWTNGGCSGTGTCTVTMTAPTAVTATFAPAPLLYWAFEGNATNTGTVAGYPLTLNGTTLYQTGKIGQAILFSTGGYALAQGSARAVLGAYAQYTISFWVDAVAPGSAAAFLDFENRSTAPYGGIQLGYGTPTQFVLCAASTTNSYLPSGSCSAVAAPALNSWHNVILRYAGTGTGAGQGGNLDVYIDGALAKTIANDSANNPIFNPGISDTFYLGNSGILLDDVRIYNTVFTPEIQCTLLAGGTWTGTTCTPGP